MLVNKADGLNYYGTDLHVRKETDKYAAQLLMNDISLWCHAWRIPLESNLWRWKVQETKGGKVDIQAPPWGNHLQPSKVSRSHWKELHNQA